MNEFLDTNVILRYLTGEPADQAELARALIDSEAPLLITDVALIETGYVLRTSYGASREEAVDALTDLVRKQNIGVYHLERDVVVRALQLCRPSGRVSFGDALIWAAARSARPARLYSFDQRFPKEDVEITRP